MTAKSEHPNLRKSLYLLSAEGGTRTRTGVSSGGF